MVTSLLIVISIALCSLILLLGGLYPHTSIPAYCLVAIGGLLSIFPSRLYRRRDWNVAISSAIAFFSFLLLRASTSPDAYIARSDLYLVLSVAVLYLVFAYSLGSPQVRVRFVFILLLVATANVIVGGIQFFKGHNFMPFDFLPRGGFGFRASGFYNCPNHLAGLLEIVMLFSLSLACWSRSNLLMRIVAGYGAAMCAAGIILSGSRGGYASSVAGLMVFGFISLLLAGKRLKREFWYAVIACTGMVILGGGYALDSVFRKSDYLQNRIDSVNLDVSFRASLAKAALKQFQINPWFGTGSRTFLYYGREFRDPITLSDPIYAHNDYLQLLAEYGMVGFAAMTVFLVFHLRSGWTFLLRDAVEKGASSTARTPGKRSEKGSRSRSAWRAVADEDSRRLELQRPAFKGSHSLALTVAAFCSVIAYSVHSIVDFNLHIPANACVMAFVFAMLATPGTNLSKSGQDSTAVNSKWAVAMRFIPPALGAWLLLVALPKLPAELCSDKAKRLLSDWRMLDSVEIATRAEAVARKGLGYDAKNPDLYFYLGEAQVLLADLAETPAETNRLYEASVAAFQRALDLSPRDVRFVLSLASSLDAVERFDEAESALAFAVELDPNSPVPHTARGAHFHARKKLEQAEAEYEIATKLTNAHFEWTRLNAIRKEIADKKALESTTTGAPK